MKDSDNRDDDNNDNDEDDDDDRDGGRIMMTMILQMLVGLESMNDVK